MLYLWGEVKQASAFLDFHLGEANIYHAYSKAGISGELVSLLHVALCLPTASIVLGMPHKGHAFMLQNFSSFDGIKIVLYDMCSKIPTMATEEDPTGLVRFSTCNIHVQMLWVLVAPKEELLASHPAEHYFKDIPSAKQTSLEYMTESTQHPHLALFELAHHCWIALAYEKMGMLGKALEFAEVGKFYFRKKGEPYPPQK